MRSISCLLILAIIIFNSCYKPEEIDFRPNQAVPSTVISQPDSLTGKEFAFDSLVWTPDENRGFASLEMENANLFSNPNRNVSIILKPDGAAFWEPVVKIFGYVNYQGYLYNIFSDRLYIWPSPANPFLVGKYFSIRITFL